MARDFEKELKALEDKKKKIKEDQLKYEVRCLKPIAESAVDVFGEGLKNILKFSLKTVAYLPKPGQMSLRGKIIRFKRFYTAR